MEGSLTGAAPTTDARAPSRRARLVSKGFGQRRPAPIPFVQIGDGHPLVCLHGGWGRAAMPFDDAIERLCGRWRMLFPHRTGYGRAEEIDMFPLDFHRREATRLDHFVRGLDLREPVVWGHSDGAVIAALAAGRYPRGIAGLVLESIHLRTRKSADFLRRIFEDPESLPDWMQGKLATEHGDPYWKQLIRAHCEVWLELGDENGSYFSSELEAIRCPTLVVVGEKDPHTTLDEAEEVVARIRAAELVIIPDAGHSPHSESRSARLVTDAVERFLGSLGLERSTR